jgi:hypothetical protein
MAVMRTPDVESTQAQHNSVSGSSETTENWFYLCTFFCNTKQHASCMIFAFIGSYKYTI